jgi:hypothetical protein
LIFDFLKFELTILLFITIMILDTSIGILGAINPAVTFIVSPLWGAFADSTGE